MNPSIKVRLVVAFLLLVLVGSAGVAVRYRAQARILAGQLAQAQAEQASMNARKALPILEVAPAAIPPVPVPAAVVAPNAEADVLRMQIAELDARVREKDGIISSLRAAMTNRPGNDHNSRTNRQAWLENLKKTDTNRYNEIMARREESRRRMQQAFAQKASHFLDRDTASMNEQELENYNTMLTLLNDTWQLSEKMRADDLPREERHEVVMTLRENVETLTPLLDAERNREFYTIAVDFGYKDEQASQFVDYLNGIVEVTSMRSVFESMRPGGHGGGDGSGRPPGRP